jgi:UMF1 family MFS transporter
MGFWFGANWAVSRSVMSYLSPGGSHNMAFGYFGLVERASSFVGPLVWGGVISTFAEYGVERYRLATLAVTSFVILGFWVLLKVRGDK